MAVNIELRIFHLLCSRICHDLIGPVGAINNGVELVREFGSGNDDEALDLVASSARQAADRLKFFRVAYGLAAGAATTVRDARGLVDGIIEPGRMTLDWPTDDGIETTALADGSIKLLLNMVLLATEALSPAGGISVQLRRNGQDVEAEVVAAGKGAQIEAQTLAGITGEVDEADLSPRTVQGLLTVRLAESEGSQLVVDSADQGVR